MAGTDPRMGQLDTTLATWVFLLADSGIAPADEALRQAIEAVRRAVADDGDADAAGMELARLVGQVAGGDEAPEALAAALARLYGAEHVATAFGEDREARMRSVRRYQFAQGLPWLARIADRFPDGRIEPHWVLVQGVDHGVRCMDPYPWDDLDEEYVQPVGDFAVKWELAGTGSLRYVR